MANYTEIVLDDSPRNIDIDLTGFYKFLETDSNPGSWPGCLERYLNTFGYVKGSDIIEAYCLDNMKTIFKHFKTRSRG